MNSAAATYPPGSIWSARRSSGEALAFLTRLSTAGDLVPFTLAGHPAFLLNHPDYVENVLVLNHSLFAKPPALQRSSSLLGSGLLTAEGELHQHRRRVVGAALGSFGMERYSRTIAESADRLQGRWHDGQIVDMAAEMRSLTLTVIGQILFGADLAPQAAAVSRALTVATASIDPLLSLLAPSRRLRPSAEYLRTLVNRLIDQHVAAGADGDDLLSQLLRAEGSDGQPVSDQVRDDVMTLFIAGHDTIANGLVWTWHLLAEQADAERRLQEELRVVLGSDPPAFGHVKDLTYTGWVLAESLRLYPPSWVITRRARADHKVGDVLIPSGAIVVISQYLLHRDARFFPKPLEFIADRWDASLSTGRPGLAYLPFGAGPRSCIGQGLAILEGVLAMAAIARRWRCRPLAPIDCDPRGTLRPRGPVPMRVERIGMS